MTTGPEISRILAECEFKEGVDPKAPIYKWDGTRLAGVPITPYNFRNPGFLSPTDLRQLTTSHEKFVELLAARLATFLRMDCGLKTVSLETAAFAIFTEQIQNPAHVTLFQIEPLRGVGILDMSLPLALGLADRLLGGKGRFGDSTRALTEIEATLVEDAVQLMLDEWARQFQDEATLTTPQIIGHETSGHFLQTAAPGTAMLTISLEITLGDAAEVMRLAVPVSMIESIVKKMQRGRGKNPETREPKRQWRAPYDQISVPVIADWAVRDVTVGEVLSLRPGVVLKMPRELIEQTRVRFSNTPEFLGTVGLENGRVAVQLTKRTATLE